MTDGKKIESLVLERFSFLHVEKEYKKPQLIHNTTNTTVSYLSKEIGIEIELDWRDLNVFVLITKLEKGELPKGYYVSHGKKCRLHIEEILKNKLNIDSAGNSNSIKSKNKKGKAFGEEHMIEKVIAYQQLVKNHIGDIPRLSKILFD
jgi:hypothetical protein